MNRITSKITPEIDQQCFVAYNRYMCLVDMVIDQNSDKNLEEEAKKYSCFLPRFEENLIVVEEELCAEYMSRVTGIHQEYCRAWLRRTR